MSPSTSLFLSFLGGVLPAMVWLLFWLREDRREPEPRHLIVATFLAGVAATIPVIFIENAIGSFIPGKGIGVLILWATVEEIAKFSAAFFVALRRKENDQPIDNMIYLMTAAIGFAAFENFFYLVDPIQQADLARGAVMGSLRFLGSTILHTVASGAVGIALAYAFCAPKWKKVAVAISGLTIAIALHTTFNFSILHATNALLPVFSFVWIGAVATILFFEYVKRINRSCIY